VPDPPQQSAPLSPASPPSPASPASPPSPASPASPSKLPTAELYRDSSGNWAPADDLLDTKTSLWRLGILRGSHTAVTFVNAKGIEINSNNPDMAVPNDRDVWIDAAPSSDRRTIFFYGRRWPQTSIPAELLKEHAALLGPPSGPALLQVWVRDYHGRNVQVWLSQPAISLNAQGLPRYRLGTDIAVPDTATPDDIWAKIDAAIGKLGNLNHLVINTHGGAGKDGGFLHLGHDSDYFDVKKNPKPDGADGYNVGFSRHNLVWWKQLAGKVKYIWIQGCAAGADNDMFGTVATNANAWVTAPGYFTGMPPKLHPGHIEYLWDNQPKHWHAKSSTPEKPVNAELFFRSARHDAWPSLRPSLYFNLVEADPPKRRGKK
jgi:hypothetical protein